MFAWGKKKSAPASIQGDPPRPKGEPFIAALLVGSEAIDLGSPERKLSRQKIIGNLPGNLTTLNFGHQGTVIRFEE